MSSAVSSLRDALSILSAKVPIGVATFVSYVLPPVTCYVVFAVLAITPQTRVVRIALWPIVALLALRATVSLAVSPDTLEQKMLNIDLMLCMFTIAAHTLSWTLAKGPLVRHLRPANSSPSTTMDTLDLALNLRGIGWDWSRGLYVPRETRPTNRLAFAFYALLSGVAHTLISAVLYRAIHVFAAGAGSSSDVPTIFDDTLPFFVRYLRSSIIATMAVFAIYAILQTDYDLLTAVCVLLLGQDPAQWPPAFDNPSRATSLWDFWGRRWHQFLRHMFLLGGYPLSIVFGRAGKVVGTFLTSAISHHFMMTMLDRQSEMWRMLVGFGMMAPGVLAERAFYEWTGRRVGGRVGWVWTMVWLLLWGNVIVDGFVRAGMFVPLDFVDGRLPVRALVENSVISFDAWLHTI